MLAVGNNLPDNYIDFDVESDNELERTINPLSAHRHAANESLVINNENLFELTPGENREIRHILFDEKCEKLPFPKIYFKEKFGYAFPHEHYLTSAKYFNQRLLKYSKKCASTSDYIFFCVFYVTTEKIK